MKSLPESPVEFLAPLSRHPEKAYITEIGSPFGPVVLSGDGEALFHVRIREPLLRFCQDIEDEWGANVLIDDGPFREVTGQLRAYFEGDTAPIRAIVRPVRGTPFIADIHREIVRVPFGETITYSELAFRAGHPGASRAAGNACGRNQVLIVVPCHRIVAVNGIGGFGTWPELKKLLLRHEGGNW